MEDGNGQFSLPISLEQLRAPSAEPKGYHMLRHACSHPQGLFGLTKKEVAKLATELKVGRSTLARTAESVSEKLRILTEWISVSMPDLAAENAKREKSNRKLKRKRSHVEDEDENFFLDGDLGLDPSQSTVSSFVGPNGQRKKAQRAAAVRAAAAVTAQSTDAEGRHYQDGAAALSSSSPLTKNHRPTVKSGGVMGSTSSPHFSPVGSDLRRLSSGSISKHDKILKKHKKHRKSMSGDISGVVSSPSSNPAVQAAIDEIGSEGLWKFLIASGHLPLHPLQVGDILKVLSFDDERALIEETKIPVPGRKAVERYRLQQSPANSKFSELRLEIDTAFEEDSIFQRLLGALLVDPSKNSDGRDMEGRCKTENGSSDPLNITAECDAFLLLEKSETEENIANEGTLLKDLGELGLEDRLRVDLRGIGLLELDDDQVDELLLVGESDEVCEDIRRLQEELLHQARVNNSRKAGLREKIILALHRESREDGFGAGHEERLIERYSRRSKDQKRGIKGFSANNKRGPPSSATLTTAPHLRQVPLPGT